MCLSPMAPKHLLPLLGASLALQGLPLSVPTSPMVPHCLFPSNFNVLPELRDKPSLVLKCPSPSLLLLNSHPSSKGSKSDSQPRDLTTASPALATYPSGSSVCLHETGLVEILSVAWQTLACVWSPGDLVIQQTLMQQIQGGAGVSALLTSSRGLPRLVCLA